ncbi:TraB/GumN family protein [Parachryseolinea silvisoli]|uniref:TraB/GumN family protein n=1 Tax=Parachryseolinea silvisoli TaxID=2873601 RepID=UPI00226591CE|nr:TraB/GumN family protein [Parachryseolinea silvisoli]MCD9014401.1 TraB/GumN family protein [Parachryseolinea silvisoli]
MAVSSLYAQNNAKRPHYKLLWKISGNGLTAPSYLFGTMHVEDDRAFEFSDSVLLKISECKAFSLEVHPDSLMRLLLPVLAGQSSKGQNRLKELLSEKEYREIDSLMQQRTGLSLDRLKTPSLVRMLLEKQAPKKGKGKGTFVDGYLYNIARRQGKSILGIEDAQEQLALLDDFAPENLPAVLMEQLESDSIIEDRSFASMLDLYYGGDIEAMSRYLKENTAMEPGYYDRLITRRNIGMTANIVRQVRKQTTFFAVGAGHLAGEEGLIYLLQQEGYTVQPVKATFTGLAKKYTYTTQEEPWYEYTSPIGAYTISMPAKPIAFAIDSVGLTFQTYVDIGTSTVFQTTYIPLHGQFKGRTPKYALDQFVERMKRGGKYKFEKVSRIDVQGLEGREIVMRQGGQFHRAQILLRGDVLYLLQVGPTKAIAYSDEAGKFLRSFRLQEFGKTVWKDFSNAAGAFSVHMPGDIKTQLLEPEMAGPTGGRYKIHLYHATDMELGETYLIRYNDFPAGLRSLNDSVYNASLITNVMDNMKGRNLQRFDRTIEGKKGVAFTFDVAETNLVIGRILLRGGRSYMLMAISSKNAAVSGIDTFLDSFRLLPTEKAVMQEFEFPLHRVKVKLPASFTTDSIGFAARNNLRYTEEYGEYFALDAQSGAQYTLRVKKFSPYEVAKDADDLFKTLNERYVDDSVRVTNRKREGKTLEQQLEVINPNANGIARERVVVSGQYMYELLVQNAQDAGAAAVDAFFNSLRFPAATDTWDLFTDKTDVLLQAAMSTDTVVLDEAIPALGTYEFTPAALPAIYAAITRASFATDDYDVRTVLLRTLDRVHDNSTVDFIKKLYPTLIDSMSWKSHALTVLTSMKTQASSQAFLELLEQEQGKPELWSYRIMQPYTDSLALLNVVLPGVIRLSDKLEGQGRIFWMARQALDSNALTPPVKKEVLALAVAKGQQRVAALPAATDKEADIHEYTYESLAQLLLLAEPSDVVKGIFQALHRHPLLVDTRMVTTEFYLKNNLTLAPSDLESIVSDPYYRIGLSTLLKTYGKEKLYPAKYLSQEKFAEGALHQSMASDDGIPEQLKLVGVRSVRYQGQKQNLYVYQYQYAGDETWSIAFSGPFPEKVKYLTEIGDYTYPTYTEYGKDVDLAAVITEVTEGEVELLK